MTWILIIVLGASSVRYVEFPTKELCATAQQVVNDRTVVQVRAVCVEGGRPIAESPQK